jgi:hypothetical protein
MAIAGLAVLMFGCYSEHYVGGAISGGSMPKLGWWTRPGDISASDGIGILRPGERRASISPPFVCTVRSE